MRKIGKSVETAIQTGNLFSNNPTEYSPDKVRNAFQFLTHWVRISESLKKGK